MTYGTSFRGEPPTVDPTVDPSSPESPAATASGELAAEVRSARLTGVLASYTGDMEAWTPETPELAQQAIADVAAYCRDYCPARLACGEEACRLWRLEQRAVNVLRPTDADAAGVLGSPFVGTI